MGCRIKKRPSPGQDIVFLMDFCAKLPEAHGKSHQNSELPIFVKWIEFLKWFLPTLEKFPKKLRFTITNRVENIALDIVELLIEAKYSREKRILLKNKSLS